MNEYLEYAKDMDDACGNPEDSYLLKALDEHGLCWEWVGGKLTSDGDVLSGMSHVELYEWLGY